MAHSIRKVGIVGAGQMGNGIAHVCALGGYKVALHDVSEEKINAGLATIDGNLARQVAYTVKADEWRKTGVSTPERGVTNFGTRWFLEAILAKS